MRYGERPMIEYRRVDRTDRAQQYTTASESRLAPHLPCIHTTIYSHILTAEQSSSPVFLMIIIPSTTSQTLRKSGATAILRPGAEARTPFGTPFFKLVIDTETDTGTFEKRRLDRRMREEIAAWEKLQRTGKLPENREYAAVLQETRFAGDGDQVDTVDAPTAEGIVGDGFVVGGEGYSTYFVPDVDRPGDGTSAGDSDATAASTDYDDRLWPDRYSIGSDSDIDYIIDGFVVIDVADATGSVFWNHRRGCRRKVRSSLVWKVSRDTFGTDLGAQHQAVRRRGSRNLWSCFLRRFRPATRATH